MANSVITEKKRRFNAAKSGQSEVEASIKNALASGDAVRLKDVREFVTAELAVESFPEGRLTRGLRSLQDQGRVERPRRGYYQLVTEKSAPIAEIPKQRVAQKVSAPAKTDLVLARTKEIERTAPTGTLPAQDTTEQRPVRKAATARKLTAQPVVSTPIVLPAPALTEPTESALIEARVDEAPVDGARADSAPTADDPARIEPEQGVNEVAPVGAVTTPSDHEQSTPDESADPVVQDELFEDELWEPTKPSRLSEKRGFAVRALLPLLWLVVTGFALVLLGSNTGLFVGGALGVVMIVGYRLATSRSRSNFRQRHPVGLATQTLAEDARVTDKVGV